MGVRFLIGEADGTTPAACLYDSTNGVVFGPLFEGVDPAEEAEAFVQWIRDRGWRDLDFASPTAPHDGTDARHWTDAKLMGLYVAWRRQAINPDTGCLRAAGEEEVPA